MRRMCPSKNSWVQGDWDISLEFGEFHEDRVRKIFEGDGTIEVKADRMWHSTGNIAVEYKFRNRPSGISTTEAKWWCVVLTNKIDPKKSDAILLCEVKKLRVHLKLMFPSLRKVNGGFRSASKLLLVPVEKFLPITI
jgi:hypothetical protein